jgi:hypothetical protein
VLAVGGLGRQTAAPAEDGIVRRGLDLRRAARALARDRSAVTVVLEDGAALVGTIDRVGADFLEVAEHALDDPRRAGAVRGMRAGALSAVTLIRTVPPGLG